MATASQTEEERRKLRQEYRNLIDTVHRDQDDLINPANNQLRESMMKADHLFQAVEMPGEAVLDAHLVKLCSTMCREKAEALDTNLLTFRPLEFAEKLVSFMSGGDRSFDSSEAQTIPKEAWIKFGATVGPLFKRSPTFHYMLGSFERGDVELRKQRRKLVAPERENFADVIASQPQKVTQVDTDSAVEKIVEQLYCTLRSHYKNNGKKPICYFKFIVNPHSYGCTIENMFHMSFLIKDGYAELFLDDESLPVIRPIMGKKKDTQQLQEAETSQINQVIISLNMEEWKNIVNVFKIREPMIVMSNVCNQQQNLNVANKKPRT